MKQSIFPLFAVSLFAAFLVISGPALTGALPQAAAQETPEQPPAGSSNQSGDKSKAKSQDKSQDKSAPKAPEDDDFPVDAGGDIVDRVLEEASSAPADKPAGQRDRDRPGNREPDGARNGARNGDNRAGGAVVEPGKPTKEDVKVIDFGEEEEGPSVEMMTAQDPTPLKHKSLIRKKFRGPAPGGVAAEQLVEVPSRWSAGVQLGGSLVSFAGVDMAEASPVGAGIGVFGEFRASRLIAIRPEARLAWQGSLADNAGTATRLGYVQIPVIVAARVPAGSATLSLGAGPALGVSMRSAIGTADLERFVMSALVDASARKRIGGSEWLVAARYEHGLSNLIQSAGQLVDIRTRVLSLGVGVMF